VKKIYKFDRWLIHFFKHYAEGFARAGFFITYFWFGALKVLGLSPASELVQTLFSNTFLSSIVSFDVFYLLFGLFEVIIGLLFLFPKMERVALLFLTLHLFTTILPLMILPEATWSGLLVPTLEGQYIIKNILFVGLAMFTALHLHPLRHSITNIS